jgi:hypothetical protein
MIGICEVERHEFGLVHDLLRCFENRRMRADDWRRMLFEYPWPSAGARRGYALFDDARAVGFIGTIESAREIRGKIRRLCNLSCWVVLPEHRARSIQLFRKVLGLTDQTLVCLTPARHTHPIFTRFGHVVLDDEVLLVPPLFSPASLRRLRGASLTLDHDAIAAALPPGERRDFEAHRGAVAGHLLIERGCRAAWVAATPLHHKHVRFAHVQHVGDPELFWDLLPLVQWGFFRALGAPAIAIDARLSGGRRPPFAISWKLSLPRLYRPATADLAPSEIDGLYTELMGLKI